jgi:hypothetical protein
VAQMNLDCDLANEKCRGNLAVGHPAKKQIGYVPLSRRKHWVANIRKSARRIGRKVDSVRQSEFSVSCALDEIDYRYT